MVRIGPIVQAGAFDNTPTAASGAGTNPFGAVLSEVSGVFVSCLVHVGLMVDGWGLGMHTAVHDVGGLVSGLEALCGLASQLSVDFSNSKTVPP